MQKYVVWMKVVGTTCVHVNANSPDEAKEIAYDIHADTSVNICHQCADEISEPTITEALEAVLLEEDE